MMTQKRHLVCTVRKKLLCRCGCAGWDTLRPVYSFLDWSFSALANGVHPGQRYDRHPFRDDEASHLARAGQPCMKGAVLHLKVDLAELGAPLGFQTTATTSDPCVLCHARRNDLVDVDAWDSLTCPWQGKHSSNTKLRVLHAKSGDRCPKPNMLRSLACSLTISTNLLAPAEGSPSRPTSLH